MSAASKICSATFVTLLLTVSGHASERGKRILDQWYHAFTPVDREIISSYLSEDAKVELQDLKVTQTRQEFIDSLDAWEDAINGGTVSYKFDESKTSNGIVTAIVCYKFSSNQMMTEEIFEFKNRQITKSVQHTLSDNCDGF